jgi:5'-3' exonuclease
MGISGFTQWILENFGFAVSPVRRPPPKGGAGGPDSGPAQHEFDHIFIDMNQLIHLQLRKAKNEDHLLVLVFSNLDQLLRHLCFPVKSVYFVLDGPGSSVRFFFFFFFSFPFSNFVFCRIQEFFP